MFTYTIDKKPTIVDPKGNTIVNFVTPLFNKDSMGVQDYKIRKIGSDKYCMRPDLLSFAMYGDIDGAEYILKFSGISNPFTLDSVDVIKIPNNTEVYGMMAANSEDIPEDINTQEEIIRNSFKYYDPTLNHYDKDGSSYRALERMKIPSGIIDKNRIRSNGNIMVPYISEDGRTAVTIRNGRIYFGEDAALSAAMVNNPTTAANITTTIQNAINKTATQLSDTNCMYNGTNLADFVRTNFNNN